MAWGTITLNKSALTSGGGYIIGKIEWSAVKNDSGNYSDVTAKLYVKKGHDSMTLTSATSGTWLYSLKFADYYWAGATTSGVSVLNDWVKMAEKTVRVSHDADGRKSITFEASVTAPDGTSYAGKVTSGKGSVSLDTIPRASAITSALGVTLGERCAVKWTPASSSFYYKIKFSLGGWSYTTDVIAPGTTSPYTYTGYTIPLSVANQLPDLKTGNMSAMLYTYSDSACTALVGSDNETFTVTVPNNEQTRPTVAVALSPVNEGLPSGFEGVYIQGKSRVKSAFTGSKANYSSTMTKFGQWVGSSYKQTIPTTSSLTSDVLATSGKVIVQNLVTDSRGFMGEKDIEIDVLPYSKPSLEPASGEKAIVCVRCDKDGTPISSGTYLKIKARRSYSPLSSGGTQYNFCDIRYRYRVVGGDWSSWVTLLDGNNISSNEISSAPIGGVVSSVVTTYEVQVGVIDDIGESAEVTLIVPTDEVNFHEREGGHGAAFGKYCEEADCLDIAPDWNVYGRLWGLGKCRSDVEEADLNDYREFGVYAISSNMAAGELKNCPSEIAGTLVVSSAIGDGLKSGVYVYILQRYFPFTGELEYVRLLFTDGNGTWKQTRWQARGETEWADLGLSTSVVASGMNYGRYAKGTCAYKVVNENHIHLAFNCEFIYNGSQIQVNKAPLPQKYKPPRELFAMCATGGRAIARVVAKPDGNVYVDWVQSLTSATQTNSSTVYWIDGYIDYWV